MPWERLPVGLSSALCQLNVHVAAFRLTQTTADGLCQEDDQIVVAGLTQTERGGPPSRAATPDARRFLQSTA